MSLFGAKRGGKRMSLVNTPDVLVTGIAAHMAGKSGHLSGPEKCTLSRSVPGPGNARKRYESPGKVARRRPEREKSVTYIGY